jgi:hypothetical protein
MGDLDGDGRDDIATANNDDDTVTVLHQREAGDGFSRLSPDGRVGDGVFTGAIADVDDDGPGEILTANERANTVSVFRKHATGAAMAASIAPWAQGRSCRAPRM